MSVEFVDTNILVYAHDGGAGKKHEKSVALLTNLVEADGTHTSAVEVSGK